MAEAVVCLDGRGLKGAGAKHEPEVIKIDQVNFRFVPETVAVHAGDSVEFLNSDSVVHNVFTQLGPAKFNHTLPAAGKHGELIERAGGIRRPIVVGCKFHGAMRSWIYVFDHPFFQVTGADGAYRFDNIPPGEYRLHMAHASGELVFSERITIKADEKVRFDIRVSADNKKGE